MKEEILTAKEWLEKEGKLDGICENNPNYKGLSYPASEAMEKYANYKNRILEAKILQFRQSIEKGSKISYAETNYPSDTLRDTLKFFDKHFGIIVSTEGKI